MKINDVKDRLYLREEIFASPSVSLTLKNLRKSAFYIGAVKLRSASRFLAETLSGPCTSGGSIS